MFRRFKIGIFLASRQIKNSNGWVNFLIIFIMTATFLNLVFVSGILEGLVTGASDQLRESYSGEIISTPADNKLNILNTTDLVDRIRERPEVLFYSVRTISGVRLDKDLQESRGLNIKENAISAPLVGLDFLREDQVTGLSGFLIEGSYPTLGSSRREIIVGSGLLDQFEAAIGDESLRGVEVGSRVRLTAGDQVREYVVGGVLKAKIGEINNRVFLDEREFGSFTGLPRRQSSEIALRVDPQSVESLRDDLQDLSGRYEAQVETWEENQGQFFVDLSTTFTLLGSFIGAIGLVVASVTLFIVFFINAILRERYIGILKGIGLDSGTIKCSYVFQSAFYTITASLIGVLVIYLFLVPYFADNPIDFPFSDGILEVSATGTALRIAILLLSSLIAGYIPAYLVTKKNTIDSILGR